MDVLLTDGTDLSAGAAKGESTVSQMLCLSPSDLQSISIVIPTLNESASIAPLLLRLDRTLTQAHLPYEAIVVDDRSTDNTSATVETLSKRNHLPARVLRKQGQPGKALSLIEGFAAAQFDVLAMIDGDLQYPPEVLPEMVHQLAHADIVVADRRRSYSHINHLRGMLSHVFTDIIVNLLFGIDTDMQSGLKVFHRRVYAGIKDPGRWSFDLHLVTQAISQGADVANVPIAFYERQGGKSKVAPLSVGMELLMTALRLKMHLTAQKFSSKFGNN